MLFALHFLEDPLILLLRFFLSFFHWNIKRSQNFFHMDLLEDVPLGSKEDGLSHLLGSLVALKLVL